MNTHEKPVPWSKPYSIDKSAPVSAKRWWQDVVTGIPQAIIASKPQHDCATAGNHTNGGQNIGPKQNGDLSSVDAKADGGSGPIADKTPMSNYIRSIVRKQNVTTSSDKRAEMADMSAARMLRECPTDTMAWDDAVLLKTRRLVDQMITSGQANERSNVTATRMPVCSHEMPRYSPSVARTDNVGRPAIDAVITGNGVASTARGKRSPNNNTESSSTEPDTAGTGSVASAGKRTASENKVDHISPHTFNVYPSVAAATKLNTVTRIPHQAAVIAKPDITKTQPNVFYSFTTETYNKLSENVTAETDFNVSTAKHDNEVTKSGAIYTRNSAANSDRATKRKLPSDVHGLVSSLSTRTDTKPAIARIIRTLSSRSRDLSSGNSDTISTDIPTKSKDHINNVEVVTTAVQESQNRVHTNKAVDSSTTEQNARNSRTTRPVRLNQTGLNSLNNTDSADQTSDNASVETGSATGATSIRASPLAVKLIRVDRMLRSVQPVAPTSIRNTGVATPAVQAQRLTSMKDANITCLSTALQTEPQTMKQHMDNTVDKLSTVKARPSPPDNRHLLPLQQQISADPDREPAEAIPGTTVTTKHP